MRQWTDFPLPDGSYSDDTRPWSQQDVCNFLPTFAEASGTRSRVLYKPAPGLNTFANVGNGPHRGSHDVEGRLFVVSGTTLYQIAVDGTATSRGTIPGTGFVSMTHNQVDGGNQLVIGTGSNSYVYDTTDSTLTATGVALLSVDFLNQRILGVDVARRFWRYSGLADATSWNTLDNESAESSPDRIVGGIVSQGEWLVFGERTIEVWQNDPTQDTAFQRGTVIERGCRNANTIKRLDNTVFFVDNNGIPCRLNGYQAVPIGSKAIIQLIAECDPDKLFAFTWEDKGYAVYYVTGKDGKTLGYDVTSSKWHRRQSFGLDRWRLNTLTKWNGAWYGGDYSNGKLYALTWGYAYEGCELMPRTIRSGVLHSSGNRVRIHGLRVLADTGREPSVLGSDLAPGISGAMPDGAVGDVVSYQYTIIRAFPGQDVTLTVNGTLPPGLALSATGLLAGTLTATGTYNWTITPSTDCATGTTLSDSAVVADTLAAAILTDAPILYWKLNETSGTNITDYSGFGRDGTIGGTPTLGSSGITLNAITDYVEFPGSLSGSPLDVGCDTSWSIEAVITRGVGSGATSVYEWIAGQWVSANFGYTNSFLALTGTASSDRGFPVGGFTHVVSSTTFDARDTVALANSIRTHLMIVRDGGSGGTGGLHLYKNGVLLASNTAFTSTRVADPSNALGFYVGAGLFQSEYGFIGKVEHVAVYDTTVSAARALYHAQMAGLA